MGGVIVLAALTAAVVVTGGPAPALAQPCAGQYDPKVGSGFGPCPPMSAAPLYERLRAVDGAGIPRTGRDAISVVVDRFTANMVGDGRVNARFKAMKPLEVERFKSNLADQLCEVIGGPCGYYGKDMKAAHAGMKITEAEWNATVENLNKALDQARIAEREKKDLLGALGPMKKDIVGQ
jgi:hemoglobin